MVGTPGAQLVRCIMLALASDILFGGLKASTSGIAGGSLFFECTKERLRGERGDVGDIGPNGG